LTERGFLYSECAMLNRDYLIQANLRPADGDSCFQAFDGLVTRFGAGYQYSGNWESSTDGFSPVGTQLASLQSQPDFRLVSPDSRLLASAARLQTIREVCA
jgi:hypothetical protein